MRTLFSGFAPNMRRADIARALYFLCNPFLWSRWQHGDAPARVEEWFCTYFGQSHAVTFDSGRTALLACLKSLGINGGDEVIVQGYTCLVVANAVRFAGGMPVFADIDPTTLTYNTDVLERAITNKTRCIIVQHTFGKVADMPTIMSIAKKYNLFVIEDCAHTIDSTYNGTKIGTFGDAAIFSFGSDKIVSSVRGGIAITGSEQLGTRLREYSQTIPAVTCPVILQHLLYYVFFPLAKPLYAYGVGKALLYVGQTLRLLAKIIYPLEKEGKQVDFAPAQYPHALASILLLQLERHEHNTHHRKEIQQVYQQLLRSNSSVQLLHFSQQEVAQAVPVLLPDPKKVVTSLRGAHIFLSLDWTGSAIVPSSVSYRTAGFNPLTCPVAHEISAHILLLPTHEGIRTEDAARIVQSILVYV